MKTKSRKIWSIPIALVMVLALAAMVGLYGIVQAQSSVSVPSSVTVVADDGSSAVVARYLVSGYNPTPDLIPPPTSGHGAIIGVTAVATAVGPDGQTLAAENAFMATFDHRAR